MSNNGIVSADKLESVNPAVVTFGDTTEALTSNAANIEKLRKFGFGKLATEIMESIAKTVKLGDSDGYDHTSTEVIPGDLDTIELNDTGGDVTIKLPLSGASAIGERHVFFIYLKVGTTYTGTIQLNGNTVILPGTGDTSSTANIVLTAVKDFIKLEYIGNDILVVTASKITP